MIYEHTEAFEVEDYAEVWPLVNKLRREGWHVDEETVHEVEDAIKGAKWRFKAAREACSTCERRKRPKAT